ncbi:MAG: Fic/DOC family N-terminal domain-containing protein, partial [Aeromicrobium sp.]
SITEVLLYIWLMRASDFESAEFGTVHTRSDGIQWFEPNPLPRHLALDDETLIALSHADAAIGRLDGIAQLLKNPDIIARPYAAREAVASSRIEGTHATLAEMYESEAGKARDFVEDVRAIEAYTTALSVGLDSVGEKQLSLNGLRNVHQRLMRNAGHPDFAGEWRTGTVWVGSPTGGPEAAAFVPPPETEIERLMADWIEWHHNPPRLPLLVRIALLHYQFLTIHPFIDGNGRVGRILIQMILEEEQALSAPLLYVSSYFASRRIEYYDRLQAVRQKGAIQEWLQFFLTAVHVQANDGVKRAMELLDLRETYRTGLSGSRSRAPELVDMLFENPIVSARQVQDHMRVSNQGALNLIRGLERRSWLVPFVTRGRGGSRYWLAQDILGLFDDEHRPTGIK